MIFWLAFFILIICLFFINRNQIRTTIENTHFLDRLYNHPQDAAESLVLEPVEESEPSPAAPSPVIPSPVTTVSPSPVEETSQNRLEQEPAAPVLTPREPSGLSPRAEQRDRSIYFMQVDTGGMVLRVRTSRALEVSAAPMTDTLRALIEGPLPDERQRGLISFIPPGTKLLSVMIRGTTAYINLSEEFQFSTFGVEGYAAQLRQIVWTATEFSTVKDVQILIEGKRVDYLGESILVGSPISRDMLP
jgi:spore germination protein GerM